MRAVVKVAFEFAPFVVGDVHDASTGSFHFGELAADLSLQAGVFQGQPGRGPGRLEEVLLVDDGRIVEEDRDRLGGVAEGGEGAGVIGAQVHPLAVHIDVVSGIADGEENTKVRVVQGAGEGGLDVVGTDPVQGADQVPDGGVGEAVAEQSRQKRHRNGEDREVPGE